MNVLLIWPRAQYETEWGSDLGAIAEPLALEYLAAGVELDGHTPRILDLRLHPDDLEKTLDEFRPDVIGVTAFSMHVRAALAVCRRAKELHPECLTVAGGHHASFLPEDFFEDQIDFVVCGEGVRPLRLLLQHLAEKKSVAGIPGLWSRLGDRFVDGGPPDQIRIDELPQPNRGLIAEDREAYFIDWMRPVALVRTSVGCPYRCTFCSLWQIMDGKYLMRDIDTVVEEMATIREDFVFLVDDEAFINGRRMLALARALKAAGIYKRYFAYCRMDTLVREREAIAAWQEIGLERLFMGIDAISAKDLNEYNKRYKVSQVEMGLKICNELGIDIFAQFVVNTDYDIQDFRQLVRFIQHHRIEYPSFTVLTPLPGTDLLKDFDSVTELQENQRPNWDLFDTAHAVTKTKLPGDVFRREYRNLFRQFRGNYAKYRDLTPAAEDTPVALW